MGTTISTLCKSCGFSNEFNFGGSRFGYRTNCPVPALNKQTLNFENVNYFEQQDFDLYIFYFTSSLKGKNEKQKTIRNFDLLLNEDDNFCPKCKKMSWTFREFRFFD